MAEEDAGEHPIEHMVDEETSSLRARISRLSITRYSRAPNFQESAADTSRRDREPSIAGSSIRIAAAQVMERGALFSGAVRHRPRCALANARAVAMKRSRWAESAWPVRAAGWLLA